MVTKYTKNQKLAVFVSYVLGYIGLQVVLIGIYAAVTGMFTDTISPEDLIEPGVMISAITGLVTFIALVVIARKNLLDDFKRIFTKVNMSYVLLGTAMMYAVNIGLGLLYDALNISGDSVNQMQLEEMIAGNPLMMILPVAFLIPVVEEILFRGVILEFFESRYGTWFAVIVSSLLFGLLHTPDLSSFVFLPIYASLGVVLGYIYVKTDKNILVPIMAHVINNSIAVLALVLINGGL